MLPRADPNVPIPLPFTDNCHCPPPLSEQRLSVVSIVCRICYDNEKEEPLITPCRCKGTVAFVHRSCLEKWLGESNTTTCELCHQLFKTERTPKYTAGQSIWKWCKSQNNQRGARGVKSDMLACGLLTPIAILITYVCLFSSDYYNQKKFASIPAAKWTSLSLLFMIAIMLIGYYLWVYSVIRLHARMWYNWWQRECIVKYVPPSSINISSECPGTAHTPNNTPMSGAASTRNEGTENPYDSVYQIECEEREIYHEALDNKMSDCKQKRSSAISSGFSTEMGEPLDFEPQNKCEKAISLIKNEGVVYIINITEPPESDETNLKAKLSPACLDAPSAYSEESEIVHVHSGIAKKSSVKRKSKNSIADISDTGNSKLDVRKGILKTSNINHVQSQNESPRSDNEISIINSEIDLFSSDSEQETHV